MKDFAEFASGIGLGLATAVQQDEDVFLMATMGILLGRRSQTLRGAGKALGMYIVARRVDRIAGHFARIMSDDG